MAVTAHFTNDFDMPTATGVAAEEIDFAPGDTFKTITIPIAEDVEIEDCETFELELSLRGATDAASSALVDTGRIKSTVYILDRTGNTIIDTNVVTSRVAILHVHIVCHTMYSKHVEKKKSHSEN